MLEEINDPAECIKLLKKENKDLRQKNKLLNEKLDKYKSYYMEHKSSRREHFLDISKVRFI